MSADAPNPTRCLQVNKLSNALKRQTDKARERVDSIEKRNKDNITRERRFNGDDDYDTISYKRENGKWKTAVDLSSDGTTDLFLDGEFEPRICQDGPYAKYSRATDTDDQREAGVLAAMLDEENDPSETDYQYMIRILSLLPQAKDGLTQAELEAVAWEDNEEYSVDQIAAARYFLLGTERSTGESPFQRRATRVDGRLLLMPPWPEGTKDKIKITLDEGECVYPPFSDEGGRQGKVRSNYAYPDDRMKVLFVGIDNGRGSVSDEEQRFVETCAQWAKDHRYDVIVLAHKPPNVEGRHANNHSCWRDWVAQLREDVYSNVLFVTGHLHPDKATIDPHQSEDVDIDEEHDRKTDTDLIILPAQGRKERETTMRLVRMTMYERGKVIEELEVQRDGDNAVLEPTGNTAAMDNEGKPASADDLGSKKGVVFSMSDLQRPAGYESFFKAVARAAQQSVDKGLPVAYTVSGDVAPDAEHPSVPVRLPQHEHLFWVPGNHCYSDNGSLEDVVAFLAPEKDETIEFVVDYVRAGR